MCLIKEVIRRRLKLQEIVSTFGHDFAIKANQMHYGATESHILQQAHGSPEFTKPDYFKNYPSLTVRPMRLVLKQVTSVSSNAILFATVAKVF